MIHRKQKGVAATEISLVVVIIILIGAVVYLFIQNNQKGNSNTAQSSKAAGSADVKNGQTSTSNVSDELPNFSTFDEKSVKQMLLAVYTPGGSKTKQEILEKYASESLLNYINNLYASSEPVMADPICLCQNSYDQAQVTDIIMSSNGATARVILGFADPSILDVTVINKSGPKLDTISDGRTQTPYKE